MGKRKRPITDRQQAATGISKRQRSEGCRSRRWVSRHCLHAESGEQILVRPTRIQKKVAEISRGVTGLFLPPLKHHYCAWLMGVWLKLPEFYNVSLGE